jgi:hypothetical protein
MHPKQTSQCEVTHRNMRTWSNAATDYKEEEVVVVVILVVVVVVVVNTKSNYNDTYYQFFGTQIEVSSRLIPLRGLNPSLADRWRGCYTPVTRCNRASL